MKLPLLPCETTMSGKFLSGIGQSLTPGRVILPRSTFSGGWEQRYHTAPLSAGPSALAGISMARIPAPCASVAVRHRVIAPSHLQAYIGGAPAKRWISDLRPMFGSA